MANEIQERSEDYFYSVIKAAMNVPGVKINRSEFLSKQFKRHYPQEVIEIAIRKNPAVAGIPSGLAMIGTVPAVGAVA